MGAFVLGALATFVFAPRPRPLHGAGCRGECRVLPKWILLPLQQRSIQPLVRLPPDPAAAHRDDAPIAAVVAHLHAGRRRRGKLRRRNAGGIPLRAWSRGHVRHRPDPSAATRGPSHTRDRTRGWWIPARRGDRFSAPPVVSSVRGPVVQHAQGVVRERITDRPDVGPAELGRTVLPRDQEGIHESGRPRVVRWCGRCCRAPRRVRPSRDAPGTCVAVLCGIPPAPREDLQLPRARLGGRAPDPESGELSAVCRSRRDVRRRRPGRDRDPGGVDAGSRRVALPDLLGARGRRLGRRGPSGRQLGARYCAHRFNHLPRLGHCCRGGLVVAVCALIAR